MFACIYGQTPKSRIQEDSEGVGLTDLAFSFSPLVEQTALDTVVLDVAGQDLLFGPPLNLRELGGNHAESDSLRALANEIERRATQSGFPVNVSVAANPDVAIHSARSFKGLTIVPLGEESFHLGNLPLKMLDFSLAGIEQKKHAEIHEMLQLWGLHTFSDFGRLPLAGVAQRLGQAGVRLQKLAQGKSDRRLVLVQPPIGFEQSFELEHPITELEPLSFIFPGCSINFASTCTHMLWQRMNYGCA